MHRQNGSVALSYHECVDERYPLVTDPLHTIYERQAAKDTGKGVTWHRPAERMTYTQIYNKGMLFAKGLLALGLRRGDNVSVFGSSGSDGVVMFVACSSLGITFCAPYVYSPIHKTLEKFTLRYNPKVILLGNAPSGWENAPLYFEAEEFFRQRMSREDVHTTKNIYYDKLAEKEMENEGKDGFTKSLDYLVEAGEIISDEELADAKSIVGWNDPCIYTASSGTTGEPKLILVGAGVFTNAGVRRLGRFRTIPDDVYACSNLAQEEYATIDEITAGFYIGNDVALLPQPDSRDSYENACGYLEAIQKHRPSMIYMDQYYMVYMATRPKLREQYDLSSVKGFIMANSSSSLTFKRMLLEEWPWTVNNYGASEAWSCTCLPVGAQSKKLTSIGSALPNIETKVVDENGNLVPRNTKGELWVRGYITFLGYKDNPQLTATKRTSDGWYKTGDCVVMDDDGDLTVIGRIAKEERFKVSGDVVYAQPIERTMKSHESIQDIAVIGRETGTTLGHEIIYCIIVKENQSITVREVLKYAEDQLQTSNEWPVRIFFYDDFPRHGNRNKTSRHGLLAQCNAKVKADLYTGLTSKEYYSDLCRMMESISEQLIM